MFCRTTYYLSDKIDLSFYVFLVMLGKHSTMFTNDYSLFFIFPVNTERFNRMKQTVLVF